MITHDVHDLPDLLTDVAAVLEYTVELLEQSYPVRATGGCLGPYPGGYTPAWQDAPRTVAPRPGGPGGAAAGP
jgi:hypothetical protein